MKLIIKKTVSFYINLTQIFQSKSARTMLKKRCEKSFAFIM